MLNKKNIRQRCIFTVALLLFYVVVKKISLPWVMISEEPASQIGIAGFIAGALGNNTSRVSLFSLGIMPYMTATIIFRLYSSAVKKDRKRTSPRKIKVQTMILAMVIATTQGIRYLADVRMNTSLFPEWILKPITLVVLVFGAVIMVAFGMVNEEWGIGKFSVFILVNLLEQGAALFMGAMIDADNLFDAVRGYLFVVIVFFTVLIMTVIYELSEFRIPVKHSMIDNKYSHGAYLAIKLNPSGTMPIMYVMTLFYLPYYVISFFHEKNPDNVVLSRLMMNFNFQSAPGIVIFVILLFALSVTLSLTLISPMDIAEDFRRNGDYIEGFRAGSETRRYLTMVVTGLSIGSALMMTIFAVVPMVMWIIYGYYSQMTMMPMSDMIMTGILVNILEELKSRRVLESYTPFL